MSQTRVQLIGDSFDTGAIFDGTVAAIDIDISSNAVISGITTVGELSTPEIKVDIVTNQSGTGPIELKEGAVLPDGKNLSGNGSIIISGTATVGALSASEIQVNTISNESGTGPIELKEGAILPAGKTLNGDGDINISGNVTIGGLLTYEDVTNIDSVGLITARSGIDVTGGGLNVDGDVQKKGNTVPSAVIGISAPSNPSICDFWTDTSGEDPILKSWNGIEWIEVGSSTPSEFAPVVNNVTLAENDPTGDRFTSQSFDVGIDMLIEGVPYSQKALKGEVTAEFSVHPNTEPVSSNDVITYPNEHQTGTQLDSEKSHTRVYVPNTEGGYSWYYIYQQTGGNEYTYVIKDSGPGTTNGTQIYQSGSGGPEVWRPLVFPPIPTVSSNWYVVASSRHYQASKHLRMIKTPTDDWVISSTGDSHCRPCQDPSTGYFGSLEERGWTGSGYRLYLKIGTTPFGSNIGDIYLSGNSRNDYFAIAYGNGRYVALHKRYSDSEYYGHYYDSSGNSLTNSDEHLSVFGNNSIRFFKFVKDLFFVMISSNIYRSTDGINWTAMSLPTSLEHLCDIRYNNSTNKYQIYGQSNDKRIYVFESNNAGVTWVQVKDYNAGVNLPFCTFGDSKIVYYGESSGYFDEYSFPYNKQTLTLSGTGADYSDFNVGDSIRPVGQYGITYHGNINSISGTTIDISSDYIYQTGDIVEAVNPTNSQTATRYLVIDATGAVSGTVGAAPGYVTV